MKRTLSILLVLALAIFSITSCTVLEELLPSILPGGDTECTHEYETTVTAPTCTAAGYTTYTCKLCQDTYTADEKDKICEGEFFAWGEDSAKSAILVYNEYPEESEITKNDFHKKFQSLAEELIAKAGYRLAKVFNDILN